MNRQVKDLEKKNLQNIYPDKGLFSSDKLNYEFINNADKTNRERTIGFLFDGNNHLKESKQLCHLQYHLKHKIFRVEFNGVLRNSPRNSRLVKYMKFYYCIQIHSIRVSRIGKQLISTKINDAIF